MKLKSSNLFPLAAISCIAASTAHGAVNTWAGSGADANWNTAANWTTTNPGLLPVSGDSLVFGAAGSSGVTLTNTLTTSAFSIAGITFNSGASSYTMSGNAFTLGGNLTNSGTAAQTLNQAITLSGTLAITTTPGGGNITLGGVINGATTGLTITGGGIATLTKTNTYTGSTSLTGGTVVVGANNTFSTGTLSITAAGQTISAPTGSTFTLGNATLGLLSGVSTFGDATNTGSLILAGKVTTTATAKQINVAANTTVTLQGIMAGPSGFRKQGPGTLILSNAANTVGTADSFIISGGTLSVPSIGAIGTASAGLILSGGNFQYTGTSASLTQNVTLTAATASSIEVTTGVSTLTLSNSLSSSGTWTKLGAGTLTLSGANTSTGLITVGAGRLNLTSTNTSAITVNSGGKFGGAATGSTTGLLTMDAGSTLISDGGATTGGFTSNGVTFTGATTFAPDSALTPATVYTVLNVGSGSITGLSNLTSTVRGSFGTTASSITFTAGTTATDTWNTTSGTWDSTTTNWSNGSDNLFALGDTVIFNTPASASTVTLVGTLNPASITFNNTSATNTYTLSGAGSIIGSGSLTLNGAGGATTIATANTYSGGTTIAKGLLVATNSSALGTGAVIIGNNTGTAQLNLGNGVNLANALTIGPNSGASGAGVLQVKGTDSATASGPITITANPGGGGHFFTDTGATLNLTGAITSASIPITQRNGNVVLSGGGSYATYNLTGNLKIGATNGVSTSASLTIGSSGDGTLNLNAFSQTLAGVTKGTGGNATITNTGATSSTLTLTNVGTITYDGTITNGTGGVSLVLSGAGTTILNASNSYNGGTNVNAGTLQVGNGNATNGKATLNGGKVTISSGIIYNVDGGLTFASNTNATVAAASGTASILSYDVNSADVIVNTGVTSSIDPSVTLQTTGGFGFRFDINGTGALTVGGPISGSGSVGGTIINTPAYPNATDKTTVYKRGAGDLTLTGASNFNLGANTGFLSLQEGRVILSGGNNRLPTTSGVVLGSTSNTNAKLVLNGVNQTLAALTRFGTGSVAVVGGSATLSTLTVNNAIAYTYSGAIGGAGTNENNLALVKSGAGTLTLSGTNTYSGTTTVNGGILSLGAASLADASAVSISSTGTLDLTHGTTDTVASLTINGVLQPAGLYKSSTGVGAGTVLASLTGSGKLQTTTGSITEYADWASAKGLTAGVNDAKSDNPDNDGLNNFGEFAFDGTPLSGKNDGKIVNKIAVIDGESVLTLTLPVLSDASFIGFGPLVSNTVHGVTYQIECSDGLTTFDLPMEQVTNTTDLAAIQGTLAVDHPLTPGWSYRTFRVAPVSAAPKQFLRARVTE